MPKQAPGSLPAKSYAEVTAYILQANGVAAGARRAPAAAAGATASAAAPGGGAKRRKPSAAAATEAKSLPSAPVSVARTTATGPSDAELVAADDADWLGYNRDLHGTRYSGLDQINAQSAARLQPVCILQTGAVSGFQSSPLFYKGVGYASTVYEVFAFDATTCERKWTYKYTASDVETMTTNRGIALYDGKIFRGTTDGHLIALDAGTGTLLWDAHVTDSAKGAFVGSAPLVYKNRVYVGTSGGEYGIRGKIFAFDADSGKLTWAFSTVPGKGEPGAETWAKGAERGGGPSWTSFALDPAEGVLYAPIGNPGPDFGAAARPGRNLYTNSIVALDAATGTLRWYVQQSPGDYHDFDTAAPPVLYEQDGRRLIGVGSKDGTVYIYDRDSHALLARTPVTTIKNVELPLQPGKANKVRVCPGPLGGVEWFGPSYSPQAKALFVGTNDWCADEWLEKTEYQPGVMYMDGAVEFAPEQTGWLKALDAASGRELWSTRRPSRWWAA
jgi:PQQ-dependent dehydrogenase (methanol/ethanol family)